MQNGNTVVSVLLVVLIVGTIAGFYYTLDRVDILATRVNNLEIALDFSSRTASEHNTAPSPTSTSSELSSNAPGTITVPSAIIFETQSSPALKPQSTLTVTLEAMQQKADGTIALGLKVFTNDASGYTALDPRSLFAIIDLQGNTDRPADVIGQFDSMPPKSAVSGIVLFQEDPGKQTIILQITSGDTMKHYEFDFSKRTYKEVVLG